MTPQEFIAKWRLNELKERSAAQSHFNDLCRLLDIPDPISADPRGEWFTFEKGVSKTSGGEGWADVWRKGCFAWEYKGKRKDLDAALTQLLNYSIGLETPPLLIVSDMDRIRIHTNWTNTVQKTYSFAIEDLTDAARRDQLRAAFLDPDRLKPDKTRQALTEDAAQKFAAIAQRLRRRGHEAHAVAHFINRLVFCMFAEDVGLLPDNLFSRMIQTARPKPETFATHAATLFDAMRTGGTVGFEAVHWFNGGLFDTNATLPLTWEDIDDLIRAAALDWADVDPSIMGTLFERGLDPDKRSQLGAHYTDRDKIMQIVTPVIIDPLNAEWAETLPRIATLMAEGGKKAETQARALKSAFLERLCNFRILDPACGSGNFLYLSLLSVKDIEHKANLDAEILGLQRDLPRTGPENVLGIELNPYAAELARVSVWIGEIQWMRRNGFEAGRNPVLRTLDTIECRNAVLGPDGGRADWPRADVVVGNPPFLGASKILGELGSEYTAALRNAWGDTVPGFADLVCFWFAKAWAQMQTGALTRAGLVSTNSIRGGANREVLKPIVDGGRIFEAWGDEAWTVDGAAVRVSLVCFDKQTGKGRLNGYEVDRVLPDLTANTLGFDLTHAAKLKDNSDVCFEGMKKYGDFDVPASIARDWLLRPINVNGRGNAEVLKHLVNAMDIVRRPEERWVIDLNDFPEQADASCFEEPFRHILLHVHPARQKVRDERTKANWWLYERPRPNLRRKLKGLDRFICTPRVAKHRIFVWLNTASVPDTATDAIARDDDTTFGILHSRFHELWALRMGTFLGVGNDPRYTPSTTFETFPFPEGLTPNIPAADYAGDPRAQTIAAAAARLNTLRENWLNPADLVKRVPEVVPGYPDRILPNSPEAAAILKKRTLTNLYNTRPAWLDHAHKALDQAVAEAYGWGADWRAGTMTDDDILARLFALNQTRAGAQTR